MVSSVVLIGLCFSSGWFYIDAYLDMVRDQLDFGLEQASLDGAGGLA